MNIYLLHGGHSFARKRAKRDIVDKYAAQGASVNSFTVPAEAGVKNPVFEVIRRKLTGQSLFAQQEAVAVNFLAPEKTGPGRRAAWPVPTAEPIIPFLARIPSNVTLILDVPVDLPQSADLLKAVKKLAGDIRPFKLPPLKDKSAILGEAKKFLAEENVQLDNYLVQRLVESTQGDWWYVFSALEQAVLLNRSGEPPTENLLKLWDLQEDQNIFRLFDAIGQGNKASALSLLYENGVKAGLKSGGEVEQTLGFVSLMARQLRQLIAAKSGLDAAAAQKDWQIPFFAWPKLKQQATHFSTEFLAQAYGKLAELQEKAKRGLYSPLPLIDFYVLYLISHRES